MNLSGFLSGHIFESCGISLVNAPTSHTVSLALVICACSDSAMPLCHALAYAITAMVQVCLCAAPSVLLA